MIEELQIQCTKIERLFFLLTLQQHAFGQSNLGTLVIESKARHDMITKAFLEAPNLT